MKRVIFTTMMALSLLGGASFGMAQVTSDSSTPPTPASGFDFGNEDTSQTLEDPDAPKAPLNPYDKKYRPLSGMAGLLGDKDQEPVIVSEASIQARFVRLPGAGPESVTLRLTAGKGVTGCLLKKNPSLSVRHAGERLEVVIDGGEIRTDKHTVRYALYQCDIRSGLSTADLTFSKADLLKDHVSSIIVSSPKINMLLQMGVDISADRLLITSVSGAASTLARKQGVPSMAGSSYGFYPAHTLVLSAPGADPSPETTQALLSLARGKGLRPLEELQPGFTPPPSSTAKIYAVDDKGLYAAAEQKPDEGLSLGSITVSQSFFGPSGATDRGVSKQVFARPPGLYE
jgi:hypothetical protein